MLMMVRLAALLAASAGCCQHAAALDNGAGALPALGWSSWNLFAGHFNETDILDMADALIRAPEFGGGIRSTPPPEKNEQAYFLLKSLGCTDSTVTVHIPREPNTPF